MLSSDVLQAESVQIDVIISQLLLIRVINTQCKQGTAHAFSFGSYRVFLEWL